MGKAAMRLKNRDLWTAALEALPGPRPVSATWEGIDHILAILEPFAACGCNHFLLPTGGGMDIVSVRPSREPGCIELVVRERTAYVVRPRRLTLECFPMAPLESFLLLELDELEPSRVYEKLFRLSEELVEVGVDYVERSHWDEGTLGEDEHGRPKPLPDDARLIMRFLSGKVMVVSKGSIWNGVPATYDGRHSNMEAVEIRHQIAEVLAQLGPKYLERMAAEN